MLIRCICRSGFDTDHAAYWGSAFCWQPYPVSELVGEYDPDVILEMLGVNDLASGRTDPTEVLAEVSEFVGRARAVDPEVDVVLGAVPQVWVSGAIRFNEGLTELAESLDTSASRVTTAAPAQVLTEDVDTYDHVHLAATGELKVAAGFADAVARLGIGVPYPRPLPVVPNGPRLPAQLSAAEADTSVLLEWVSPPGANQFYVWMRDLTARAQWMRLAGPIREKNWTVTGLEYFHDYAFRLQSAKGTAVAEDIFSETRAVSIDPPAVARVAAQPRSHGLRVSWSALNAAQWYQITWRPRGHQVRWAKAIVPGTSLTLPFLVAGHPYRVRIAGLFGGKPGPVVSLLAAAGGPIPGRPTGLEARDRLAHSVLLDWASAPKATRYQVWLAAPGGWRQYGWTHGTRFLAGHLRPEGAVRFKVRAWHEHVPGGWTRTLHVDPPAG